MRRRWSRSSRLFAGLAVVLGAAAFLLVRGYEARVAALGPALGKPAPVLVAASDLSAGTVLSAGMLSREVYPSRFVPPGSVLDADRAAGRVLVSPLAEGEVLTRTRLAPPRAGPVAALVPPGFRAVSITSSLPPGSIHRGDRVDLLATFAGGHPHTETVATGLQVLTVASAPSSAGAPLGETAAAGSTGSEQALILLVAPDEAEGVAYAKAFADVTVSVEGPSESEVTP